MISTALALTQTLREIYRNKIRSVGDLEPDLVYLQYKNKHLTMTSIPFRIHTVCKTVSCSPAIHEVYFPSENDL